MSKAVKLYAVLVAIAVSIGISTHLAEYPSWGFVLEERGWSLKKDGKDFFIRGAVMHHKVNRPELFNEIGGNVVRVEADLELIAEAYKSGLYSYVNLPVLHQRDGMDWSCENQVAEQLRKIIEVVERLKHHPGVMMWSIGNEHGIIPNEGFNTNYDKNTWKKLDGIAKSIKAVDTKHPVGFCIAGVGVVSRLKEIAEFSENLDFIGINAYGELSDIVRDAKTVWKKPIIFSEWGIDPWWTQSWKAHWRVFEEATSYDKAKQIQLRSREIEDLRGSCVGGFVFYWGEREEHSVTYWGLLHKDKATDSVGALAREWEGVYSDRRPLRMDKPVIKNQYGDMIEKGGLYSVDWGDVDEFQEKPTVVLVSGESYEAIVTLGNSHPSDIELDWEIREGLGKRTYYKTVDESIELEELITSQNGLSVKFNAPNENGIYRLIAYAQKGQDHISYSNIVFTVGRLKMDDRDKIEEFYKLEPLVLVPCD